MTSAGAAQRDGRRTRALTHTKAQLCDEDSNYMYNIVRTIIGQPATMPTTAEGEGTRCNIAAFNIAIYYQRYMKLL